MPRQKLSKMPLLRNLFLTITVASFAYSAYGMTFRVLYGFSGGDDGSGLYGAMVVNGDGNLYGTTCCGGPRMGGTVFKLSQKSRTWSKELVYSLDPHSDGASPNAAVIFDAVGNLYGTTAEGGPQLFGTIFQLVPSPGGQWNLNVLYEVGSFAGLTIDPAGNLYGLGAGAFELSPTPEGWTYQQIYDFSREGDGGDFYSAMIRDSAGNLYGTTLLGGNPEPYCPGGSGCGTVFKLHPNGDGTWTEHRLHRFATWKNDGQYSNGGVVQDAAGNLYGTTLQGGKYRTQHGICEFGCGTIYKLSKQPDGRWKETILYNYPTDGSKGWGPGAGPTLDADGNLYGTAGLGGDSFCSCGVIYKLTHNPDDTWTYKVLHRFKGNDGAEPSAPLVMDKKGNLYGTTITGGPGGKGVVFKLTP